LRLALLLRELLRFAELLLRSPPRMVRLLALLVLRPLSFAIINPSMSVSIIWETGLKRLNKQQERGFAPDDARFVPAWRGSAQRVSPFLGLFIGVELANERVDASCELGKKSDFVPGAAVAFRDDDRINENWNDDALGIIKLRKSPKLRERFAPRCKGIRKRFSPSDAPGHHFNSRKEKKDMPFARGWKPPSPRYRTVSALTAGEPS
jgi:hypothetical protein